MKPESKRMISTVSKRTGHSGVGDKGGLRMGGVARDNDPYSLFLFMSEFF